MEEKDEREKIQKVFLKEMNKKLSKLRQLHLVHVDIKPGNILYSPGWRKIVLVDFGLATFIKESVEERRETYFIGTPHYAGKEMKELFEEKKSGFVNLYKNDYQMLLKTARRLFSVKEMPQSGGHQKS